MEDRVHCVPKCSRLDQVRQTYLMKIRPILSRIGADVRIDIMSNLELLMQLLVDSTSLGLVPPILCGVLCLSLFWYALLYVLSSFAIILTRKRVPVALLLLSFGCFVTVNVR